MEQADSAVVASELLAGGGFIQECVSRAYYAMFCAVLALLPTKGSARPNTRLRSLPFDREFMAPRALSRELFSWLHDAFEKRLEADFALRPRVTPGQASTNLGEARAFLAAVTEYLCRVEPSRPNRTPTAVFVKPQVGHQNGSPKLGGFEALTQNRHEFYASTHLQTIQFEIARRVVRALTEGTEGRSPKLKLQARHQLLPQVYRLAEEHVARKVNWNGEDRRELGLETYVKRIEERLIAPSSPTRARESRHCCRS